MLLDAVELERHLLRDRLLALFVGFDLTGFAMHDRVRNRYQLRRRSAVLDDAPGSHRLGNAGQARGALALTPVVSLDTSITVPMIHRY